MSMKSVLRSVVLCVSILFPISAGGETPNPVPLGDEAIGVTLKGHLEGRTVYYLDSSLNRPNCWMDSIHWTGTELYYGISAIRFTGLISGGVFEFDGDCNPPSEQVDGDFDIYRAELGDRSWNIAGQADLNGPESDAAMSYSGGTIAFVRFHMPPGSFDIYLAIRTGRNSWDRPAAFERNSPCQEDNPEIYAGGTKMVFESSRIAADGSRCDSNSENKSLWFSEMENGSWTMPTALAGPPSVNEKNTQPWVDEDNGYLYWTADKECACVRRVRWVDDRVVGDYQDIVIPSIAGLSRGTADGKIVFAGEYSEGGGYAFFACGLATKVNGGRGSHLFLGRWKIDIRLCVVPPDPDS